jgi:hypothetical protein
MKIKTKRGARRMRNQNIKKSDVELIKEFMERVAKAANIPVTRLLLEQPKQVGK